MALSEAHKKFVLGAGLESDLDALNIARADLPRFDEATLGDLAELLLALDALGWEVRARDE